VLVKFRGLLNDEARRNMESKVVTLEQSKLMGWLKTVVSANMYIIVVTPCVLVKVMGLFSGVALNMYARELTFLRSQSSEINNCK